jgi:hypothetical protein
LPPKSAVAVPDMMLCTPITPIMVPMAHAPMIHGRAVKNRSVNEPETAPNDSAVA